MRDVVAKVCLLVMVAAAFGPLAGAGLARALRETVQETPGSAATPPFKIIVHAENPTPELSRAEISRIFLKETSLWPHGVEARPVDQAIGAPLRESFSRAVHDKRASAIRNYWQQEIYAGRNVPPPERSNDDAVAQYVRENSGAIGYVSEAVDPPGVRVLTIVD